MKINNIVEYLENEAVEGFYLKLSFLTLSEQLNETYYSLKPIKDGRYYGYPISPLTTKEVEAIFKRLGIDEDVMIHFKYDLNFN